MVSLRQLRKEALEIQVELSNLNKREMTLRMLLSNVEKAVWALRDKELEKLLNEMIESGQILSKCKHDNFYHWEKESNGAVYDREGCSKCKTSYVYNYFGHWLSWEEKDLFVQAAEHIYQKYNKVIKK